MHELEAEFRGCELRGVGRHGQCTQAERWGTLGSDGEAAHRMSARALGVNLVFIRSQRCGGGGMCPLLFCLRLIRI